MYRLGRALGRTYRKLANYETRQTVGTISKWKPSGDAGRDAKNPRRLRPYRARYRDKQHVEHRNDFRIRRDAQE